MNFGTSIKLFTISGTAVRLHPTFFLLLAWIAGVQWLEAGPAAALSGVVFIVALFVCVVLHEFGHIYAAKLYGIGTADVTILPIGGVASLDRMPEKPGQEIVVALAGPAVTLVLAVLFYLVAGTGFDPAQVGLLDQQQGSLVARLATANMALFVFNLIPAFPMDGGRVLRALLALPLGFTKATRVAAMIGQGLAIALGFAGLFGNPMLILVAVFVFLAAAGEAGFVQARDLTRGFLASHAMITSFETLGPQSTADDAASLLLRTTQQEFPVLGPAGNLLGVVTRSGLIEAIRDKGRAAPVSGFMTTGIPLAGERADLGAVYQTLLRQRVPMVGIVDQGQRLVGYVTAENFAELVMIRGAGEARPNP